MTYCLKCKKDTENVDSKVLKIKNDRTMLSSKCDICGSKKRRFMKEQEAKRISSNLSLKTLLSNIPLFGDILFYFYCLNLLNVVLSTL